jgi:hypothetical protein
VIYLVIDQRLAIPDAEQVENPVKSERGDRLAGALADERLGAEGDP